MFWWTWRVVYKSNRMNMYSFDSVIIIVFVFITNCKWFVKGLRCLIRFVLCSQKSTVMDSPLFGVKTSVFSSCTVSTISLSWTRLRLLTEKESTIFDWNHTVNGVVSSTGTDGRSYEVSLFASYSPSSVLSPRFKT